MSTQFKKGFTLIELMVVIVIIGILAAIAIPKLFGMTAKAKASEVGPAVGTWSKLQQAFVMEIPHAGSFSVIGYTAPGDTVSKKISRTTNFTYTDKSTVDTSTTADWEAKGRVKLNDCDTTAGVWLATFTAADQKVTETKISNASVLNKVATGDCGSLTPNFGYLK